MDNSGGNTSNGKSLDVNLSDEEKSALKDLVWEMQNPGFENMHEVTYEETEHITDIKKKLPGDNTDSIKAVEISEEDYMDELVSENDYMDELISEEDYMDELISEEDFG